MPTASSIQRLCRETELDDQQVEPPVAAHFGYPERILQFGTGAFLRGFTDLFIDEANRQGLFDGRIVIVGSTGSGRAGAFNEQDGLYTVCIQGIDDGEVVNQCRVIGSVSRALASTEDWDAVLDFVVQPELRYVVSNTTEVGIRYDEKDRPDLEPPRSFPGKLASLLRARAEAFEFDPERGLIVLCCELIERNGDTLREIVLRLADEWSFGSEFGEWVRSSCRFCNTLVDRIVPGTPSPRRQAEIEERLGYRDPLYVQAEPYGLWAIEGEEALRERLPFSEADPAIVITTDIEPFRERKVRILNGAHSVMVPLSFLCGNDTVGESMEHPHVSEFVQRTMLREIVPSMNLDREEAERFAYQVIDRFANPFVEHELLSIALHQTSKMDVRVMPSLHAYAAAFGGLPARLTFGFAAFLAFVLGEGRASGVELPADERAEIIRSHRSNHDDLKEFVHSTSEDASLWNRQPAALPEFVNTVSRHLEAILDDGASSALERFLYGKNGQEGR